MARIAGLKARDDDINGVISDRNGDIGDRNSPISDARMPSNSLASDSSNDARMPPATDSATQSNTTASNLSECSSNSPMDLTNSAALASSILGSDALASSALGASTLGSPSGARSGPSVFVDGAVPSSKRMRIMNERVKQDLMLATEASDYLMRYTGHCNNTTDIKVCFFILDSISSFVEDEHICR